MVAVADEHGIEVGEELRQDRLHLAPDRSEAGSQDRVREDPEVIDLDQDGGVAEEREAAALGPGGIRRGGRTDGSPGVVDGGVAVRHATMVPHSCP